MFSLLFFHSFQLQRNSSVAQSKTSGKLSSEKDAECRPSSRRSFCDKVVFVCILLYSVCVFSGTSQLLAVPFVLR